LIIAVGNKAIFESETGLEHLGQTTITLAGTETPLL
jgi:hypothetical protein